MGGLGQDHLLVALLRHLHVDPGRPPHPPRQRLLCLEESRNGERKMLETKTHVALHSVYLQFLSYDQIRMSVVNITLFILYVLTTVNLVTTGGISASTGPSSS